MLRDAGGATAPSPEQKTLLKELPPCVQQNHKLRLPCTGVIPARGCAEQGGTETLSSSRWVQLPAVAPGAAAVGTVPAVSGGRLEQPWRVPRQAGSRASRAPEAALPLRTLLAPGTLLAAPLRVTP